MARPREIETKTDKSYDDVEKSQPANSGATEKADRHFAAGVEDHLHAVDDGEEAPDSTSAENQHVDGEHHDIAELAYHKFLARGGEHGRHLEDWLEAQSEANGRKKRQS